MAPPTIAPPIRPAAMPTPTPSWAWADGVAVTSEPAIVATVRAATKVFFILLALLRDGMLLVRSARGSKVHADSDGIGLAARKRANGQSAVNAHGAVTRKSGLFQAPR